MRCNVCGGEIPVGENVCKYCGNVIVPEKNAKEPQKPTIEMPPRVKDDIPGRPRVYQQNRDRSRYCTKCGRPLDGVTHKCIVCDNVQVSQRAYQNPEFRNAEMNIMAQKKKTKKKKNTALIAILAILGTVLLFTVALLFAKGIVADWMGINTSNEDDTSSVTMTDRPKKTADPNWEAERDNTASPSTPVPTKSPTVAPTKAPVRTPVPEEKGDPVELRGGEYLYPSDTHVISEGELDAMTRQEIKYVYWEIYARHGYTFDDDLADYFENNHEWYMPITSDKSKVESEFNSAEKRNLQIIYDYQKKKGWR